MFRRRPKGPDNHCYKTAFSLSFTLLFFSGFSDMRMGIHIMAQLYAGIIVI